MTGCLSSSFSRPSCFFSRKVVIRCSRCEGVDQRSMLMRMVWLAPVAVLLMLSAVPRMVTLSLPKGASPCASGNAVGTVVNTPTTLPASTVAFIGTSSGPSILEQSSVLQSKHPHGTPFRHFGELARADGVEPVLHPACVDAPPRLHGDVLAPSQGERRRLPDDAGSGGELPQDLSRPGIERPEHAVGRSAAEDQPAAGGEHGSPVRRPGEVVGPRAGTRVHVPGLHFPDVVGARHDGHHGPG